MKTYVVFNWASDCRAQHIMDSDIVSMVLPLVANHVLEIGFQDCFSSVIYDIFMETRL